MSEEDSIVTLKQIELGHQEDEPNTLFLTLTDSDGNVSRFNFSRTDLTALIGALIQMEAQGNAQRNLLQSPSRL